LKDNAGHYTVWSTDNNGNYIANIIGTVNWRQFIAPSDRTGFSAGFKWRRDVGIPVEVPAFDSDWDRAGIIWRHGAETKWTSVLSLRQQRLWALFEVSRGDVLVVRRSKLGHRLLRRRPPALRRGLERQRWPLHGWSTDNNGNYIANIIGTVTGANSSLQAIEPVFQQDLNGDGRWAFRVEVLRLRLRLGPCWNHMAPRR
jgi:hypothetical protein